MDTKTLKAKISKLDEAIASSKEQLEKLSNTVVQAKSDRPEDVLQAALGSAEFDDQSRIDRIGYTSAIAAFEVQRTNAEADLEQAQADENAQRLKVSALKAEEAMNAHVAELAAVNAEVQKVLGQSKPQRLNMQKFTLNTFIACLKSHPCSTVQVKLSATTSQTHSS